MSLTGICVKGGQAGRQDRIGEFSLPLSAAETESTPRKSLQYKNVTLRKVTNMSFAQQTGFGQKLSLEIGPA